MAFGVTWINVEHQNLSRASGTKPLALNPFPGMNSWANLDGPSGTKTGGMFPHNPFRVGETGAPKSQPRLRRLPLRLGPLHLTPADWASPATIP